jgi:P27 family predicted phage terminase small subunit
MTWLDANPHTYEVNGMVRIHPNVRLADALAEQLLRIEQQLGLTPAARSKVSAEAAPASGVAVRQRFRDIQLNED